MQKNKLKHMPIVPPEDGEMQLHNSHYRLNPKGHKELVINKKGGDEETLNELSSSISQLIEYIDMGETSHDAMSAEMNQFDRNATSRPNQTFTPTPTLSSGDREIAAGESATNMTGSTPRAGDISQQKTLKNTGRNKYILSGDDAYNESFTGTASIAIAPIQYDILDDESDSEDDDEDSKGTKSMSENIGRNMKKKTLVEWQPEFAAGEYSPGEYKMDNKGGEGLTGRNVKKMKGPKPGDMKNHGDAFGAGHHETAAMCDVEESGVEDKPQGVHKSTHGQASDGHTSEVGHNWPNQPRHKGGGVGEPMGGSRYSDGGVLGGSTQMEWSPEKIGNLMGEEVDIQALFDAYARSNSQIHLEGFVELLRAHGSEALIDEGSFVTLLKNNKEFIFHEYNDNIGPYWLSESVLSEFEIRDPEGFGDMDDMSGMEGMEDMGGMDDIGGMGGMDDMDDMDDMGGMDDMDGMDSSSGFDRQYGGGQFGGEDVQMQCPNCRYAGMEQECPQCGEMMMGSESDLPDTRGGDFDVDAELDAAMGQDRQPDYSGSGWEDLNESFHRFMKSVKTILQTNDHGDKHGIGESLNNAWDTTVGECNIRHIPKNVRSTLNQLRNTFPQFSPLVETTTAPTKPVTKPTSPSKPKPTPPDPWSPELPKDAPMPQPKARGLKKKTVGESLDNLGGKGLQSKVLKKSPDLEDQPGPDEMEQHGQKDKLLTRSPKNSYTTTPVMKGTGNIKVESAERNYSILCNNVDKLAGKIKPFVQQCASNLSGRHDCSYNVAIREGNAVNRTVQRKNISEAIADLEEILQFHDPKNVKFETRFKNASGVVVMKRDLPLATITPRGPIVAEGKMLFRFKRNAQTVAEGLNKISKVEPHSWGCALRAKVNLHEATMAFRGGTHQQVANKVASSLCEMKLDAPKFFNNLSQAVSEAVNEGHSVTELLNEQGFFNKLARGVGNMFKTYPAQAAPAQAAQQAPAGPAGKAQQAYAQAVAAAKSFEQALSGIGFKQEGVTAFMKKIYDVLNKTKASVMQKNPGQGKDPEYETAKASIRQVKSGTKPIPDQLKAKLEAQLRGFGAGNRDYGVNAANTIVALAKRGHDVSRAQAAWDGYQKKLMKTYGESYYIDLSAILG